MSRPVLKTKLQSRFAGSVRQSEMPDLQTQLESLLDEVWRQERFERRYPYYCATVRDLGHRHAA